jgi:hypothetical protein
LNGGQETKGKKANKKQRASLRGREMERNGKLKKKP